MLLIWNTTSANAYSVSATQYQRQWGSQTKTYITITSFQIRPELAYHRYFASFISTFQMENNCCTSVINKVSKSLHSDNYVCFKQIPTLQKWLESH